jgi:hypothetical protein
MPCPGVGTSGRQGGQKGRMKETEYGGNFIYSLTNMEK